MDAQFCQFGVPARKESFASKIWMSQFKQITLVKKAELQLTSIDELTNRCAFERCDPIDPFEVAEVIVDPLLFEIMPRSPTSTRVLMPNLFLTISTWGINVVLSDSLPAKTDTATGQPRLVSD